MFTPTIFTILISTEVHVGSIYLILYFVYAIVAIIAVLMLRGTKDKGY